MKKTGPPGVVPQDPVIATMVAGERYTSHQLVTRVKCRISEVQVALKNGVAAGVLRKALCGRANVYWIPTQEEIISEQQRAARYTRTRAILRGYDAENQRFQALCMAARPRLR